MHLNRALRMMRWTPVAAILVAAACQHGDADRLITVNGDTLILNIAMTTQAAGGLPTGTRSVNRYMLASFDTSIADAFSRATTNPPNYFPDPSCYGSTPLIRSSGPAKVATYQSPQRYLPAMPYRVTMEDGCGGGQSVNLIAPKGHPGNGAGNQVWEFWYYFSGALASTRYVEGVARYAVQVRGALDISEMLLTGTITQPDSLVFRTGDFNPGGKKSRDRFTTSCTSVNVIHPVAGANPHLLGSDTTNGGFVDLDQTVCAATGEAWSDLGTATSPVPKNNSTALGNNQYNFYVIWEALPDSTPNYAKPVFREQIGPLLTTTGQVVNNSYGPMPTAALVGTTLAILPGGNSVPDTVTLDLGKLARLASGSAYQVWFTKAGSDSAAKATGKVYKIVGGVAVDSQLNVSEFNPDTTSGATWRMRVDYASYAPLANFDAVLLTIASAGGTTRPTAQPLWSILQRKVAGGPVPTLSATMPFGSFVNGDASGFRWAPSGGAAGGITGRDLIAQPVHLIRPPVGYYFNAYLRNGTTGAALDLGPLTGPYPDYSSLIDADVNATGSVNQVEVVESFFRWTDPSTIVDTTLAGKTNLGDFGSGRTVPATWNAEICGYDLVQVRLEPKTRASGVVAPTLALQANNPRLSQRDTYCRKPVATP